MYLLSCKQLYSGGYSGFSMVQLSWKRHFVCLWGMLSALILSCHLMPQFQSLHVKRRISVVSKLVYLLQVLPAHWPLDQDSGWRSCKNSSAWILLGPYDKNVKLYFWPLCYRSQSPEKILSNRKWVIWLSCHVATTIPF